MECGNSVQSFVLCLFLLFRHSLYCRIQVVPPWQYSRWRTRWQPNYTKNEIWQTKLNMMIYRYLNKLAYEIYLLFVLFCTLLKAIQMFNAIFRRFAAV